MTIYDYTVTTGKGEELKLSDYRGKVILIVNTATSCGFTPHYADIVEAILAGIEPDRLSIAKLTEQPIPEDWNEQRRLYGFPTR